MKSWLTLAITKGCAVAGKAPRRGWQHGPYCGQLRRVLRQKGPRRAIGNRRAAAATDIENSVVIAGVVQTLYAD